MHKIVIIVNAKDTELLRKVLDMILRYALEILNLWLFNPQGVIMHNVPEEKED